MDSINRAGSPDKDEEFYPDRLDPRLDSMIGRTAIAIALVFSCSFPSFGGDASSVLRPNLNIDFDVEYSSLGTDFAKWIDEPGGVVPADGVDCGSIVPCGGLGERRGSHARHGAGDEDTEEDSIIDLFLPRSNLPLPLMSGFAEEREIVLPLPLGTSVVWTEMDRFVAVDEVRLGLNNNPPVPVNRVEVPTSKFHASSKIARIDMWVLPCFNLYALVGHTRSTGNVDVVIDQFPLPISPPVSINVPVDLQGPTGGWGCTTGIGANDWIATLDVNQTWTAFTQLDSKMTALVVTPRVGRVVDQPWYKGEIHIGAMWQDTAQTVELTIDHAILGNDLHVQVDQFEPDPWNFLVGGLWAIDERLQIMYEGGMGGRSYVVSGITIRY